MTASKVHELHPLFFKKKRFRQTDFHSGGKSEKHHLRLNLDLHVQRCNTIICSQFNPLKNKLVWIKVGVAYTEAL